MAYYNNNSGFVQILVIFLIIIVALSLLGINFKTLYQKMTTSQTLKDNINFIKEKILDYYFKIKLLVVTFFKEEPKTPQTIDGN